MTVDEMLASPSYRMQLRVGRSERQQDEHPDLTISREAMDELTQQMALWVGTRITRHWRDTGEAAQTVEVEVNVKLDGSPGAVMALPFKISVPDGSHRSAAGPGDHP